MEICSTLDWLFPIQVCLVWKLQQEKVGGENSCDLVANMLNCNTHLSHNYIHFQIDWMCQQKKEDEDSLALKIALMDQYYESWTT